MLKSRHGNATLGRNSPVPVRESRQKAASWQLKQQGMQAIANDSKHRRWSVLGLSLDISISHPVAVDP
jgi:hypothetical protein